MVRKTRSRRDSKAVMQRPAKPFRPVRLRLAPPDKEKALIRQGFFFVCCDAIFGVEMGAEADRMSGVSSNYDSFAGGP